MGHQQEPKTASGTNLDGTAMTQEEAVAKLGHRKYSFRWVKFELFDDDGYFDDVYASARTDYINTYVAREFRRWRRHYRNGGVSNDGLTPIGTLRLGPIWEIGTTTRNVGSYEAVSNFQNPSGNTALGKADAEDEEADKYIGTIYWEYSHIFTSGAWSRLREGWHECDFTTIKTKHAATADLVKNNQTMIGEPKISAGAQRFFENKDVYGWKTVFWPGYPPAYGGSARVWDVVRKKRVCNQTESDQYKKTD